MAPSYDAQPAANYKFESEEEKWAAVDEYHTSLFKHGDPALDHSIENSEENGLPNIMVSRTQAKTLQIFIRAMKPKFIVEVGTLGGYSTIWLARALPPGGKLITLELDEKHAQVARENLAKAGLSEVVTVRTGPALDTLKALDAEGVLKDVDFWFIDADKENNKNYVEFALAGNHSHDGTVIIVDNVIRRGAVIEENSTDSRVIGTRELNDAVARWEKEGKVSATTLQTVSEKSYDGMCIMYVGKNLE